MHPTTFQIRLRAPFGLTTQHSYVFYIHAESHNEALAWVQRVFEGIDVRPTLFRWENPDKVPKIGNTDPVAITHCDSFSRRGIKNGVRQFVAVEPGSNNRSLKEICTQLYELVSSLQHEYKYNREALLYNISTSKSTGVEMYAERATECRHNIERAKAWRNAVLAEYLKLEQQMDSLELAA